MLYTVEDQDSVEEEDSDFENEEIYVYPSYRHIKLIKKVKKIFRENQSGFRSYGILK